MKVKIIIFFIFTAGIFTALAQSNPSSTNGVDMEMPLPWPNGGFYASSFNGTENSYEAINWSPTINVTNLFNANWSYAGGGSGIAGVVGEYTNDLTWAGAVWPDIILTNPSPPVGLLPFVSGSINFTYYQVPDDYYTFLVWQYTEQGVITLVTGGSPGATGNELFCISYSAENWLPTFGETIPPQQVSVSGLGSLDTNGDLYVSLPLHTTLPITPNLNTSGLNYATPGVQPYQLVSQCVSPIPSNQARTTIGVGEQVNLSFSPTLPINAVWKTTGGTLSSITNTSTRFTAPSSAGSVTVSASVRGQPPSSITFNVVAPSGIATAAITGTNHFPVGEMGAGMTDEVWIAPTNVSFYRVTLIELQTAATNFTGYFTNSNISSLNVGSGGIGQDNDVIDTVNTSFSSYSLPLYPGSFQYRIPVYWQVAGSSQTNYFGTFVHTASLLDSSGDFSVNKYGITITRSLDDVSYSSQ